MQVKLPVGVFSHCVMDGRMDGRTDGWTDGRIDGWTDRWTDKVAYRDASKIEVYIKFYDWSLNDLL